MSWCRRGGSVCLQPSEESCQHVMRITRTTVEFAYDILQSSFVECHHFSWRPWALTRTSKLLRSLQLHNAGPLEYRPIGSNEKACSRQKMRAHDRSKFSDRCASLSACGFPWPRTACYSVSLCSLPLFTPPPALLPSEKH